MSGSEEWREEHGSDHLRDVPVVARPGRGLQLVRPGGVREVGEASRRSQPPVAALKTRDDAKKAPRSRTASGGGEGRPPPGKRVCVGSLIAGPVLKVQKGRKVAAEGGSYTTEAADPAEASRCSALVKPASSVPEEQESSSPSRASTEGGPASSPRASTSCLPPAPALSADRLAAMLLELLARRIAMSESHSEREVLRKAAHVMQCAGCKDSRLHGKGCDACKGKNRKDGRNKIDQQSKAKEKDHKKEDKESKKGERSIKKSDKPAEQTEAATSALPAPKQGVRDGGRKLTAAEGDLQDVEGPIGSYWSLR